jgi:hypothetical protein
MDDDVEKKPLHLKTDAELTDADRDELYRSEQWDWATEREAVNSLSDPVPFGPLPVRRITQSEWHGTTVKRQTPGSIEEIAHRRAARLGLIERLGAAKEGDINRGITEVYDEAARNKQKPPNIIEIGPAVLIVLAKKGLQCSENRIRKLAKAERHAARRGAVGKKVSA